MPRPPLGQHVQLGIVSSTGRKRAPSALNRAIQSSQSAGLAGRRSAPALETQAEGSAHPEDPVLATTQRQHLSTVRASLGLGMQASAIGLEIVANLREYP